MSSTTAPRKCCASRTSEGGIAIRELFLSDIHFRFQDTRAWPLALKIVKTLQPGVLWLGGDIVDFYAVSSWDRNPKRRLMLQDELDVAQEQLRALRNAAPAARIVFQEGNHEVRLRRFLWNRASELSGLRAMTLPALLGLDALGIEYIETGNPTQVGHLWHIHGDEIRGGNVNIARAKLLKAHANIIFGHHHRFQADFLRTLDGKTYGAWANGCLCGLNPEYDINPQWTHGLSVVDYAKSGAFHVAQVPFFTKPGKKSAGLTCVIDGEML